MQGDMSKVIELRQWPLGLARQEAELGYRKDPNRCEDFSLGKDGVAVQKKNNPHLICGTH